MCWNKLFCPARFWARCSWRCCFGWLRQHLDKWPKMMPVCVHAEGQTLAAVLMLAQLAQRPLHVCHVATKTEVRYVTLSLCVWSFACESLSVCYSSSWSSCMYHHETHSPVAVATAPWPRLNCTVHHHLKSEGLRSASAAVWQLQPNAAQIRVHINLPTRH